MGVSTNGKIFYGIVLDEEAELPWGCETEWEGDLEAWWWEGVLGHKPVHVIYDRQGNHKDGVAPTNDQEDAYWKDHMEFSAEHPVPINLVNVCSGEYPIYALAVSGTKLTASRGSPVAFDPASLVVDATALAKFKDFCEVAGIPCENLGWHLSSYWG
jgi:hypothetical protein